MAASAFAFYRGAALPMAADLSTTPNTGLNVQLCGDAHLANFGGFASPERDLVFDINDFDETAVGPFEWDVKRLAASVEIAGRELGYPDRALRDVVLDVGRTYRQMVRYFARTTKLDTWYARLDVAAITERWGSKAGAKAVKNFRRAVVKAESKDRLRARDKLTTIVGDELRFLSDPPLLVPVEDVYSEPEEARTGGKSDRRRAQLLWGNAHARSPASPEPVSIRRAGPKGRRCRQRRHSLLGCALCRGGCE